jgi:hypothetical protein
VAAAIAALARSFRRAVSLAAFALFWVICGLATASLGVYFCE